METSPSDENSEQSSEQQDPSFVPSNAEARDDSYIADTSVQTAAEDTSLDEEAAEQAGKGDTGSMGASFCKRLSTNDRVDISHVGIRTCRDAVEQNGASAAATSSTPGVTGSDEQADVKPAASFSPKSVSSIPSKQSKSGKSKDSAKKENSARKKRIRAEREKSLNCSLEEKRKLYACGMRFCTLDSILTWPEFYKANKSEVEAYVIRDRLDKRSMKTKVDEVTAPCDVDDELNCKVSIWNGNITALEIDCIVNAANNSLLGGGGVDGAIHSAAGFRLYDECTTLNGCETGKAKDTAGYDLPAKYVIHTVGPIGEKPTLLQHCYNRCLQKILKLQQKTIAFPCISTGVYGYPSERAAHVALRTLRCWLEDLKKQKRLNEVERVIFCLFLPVDMQYYSVLMQKYFPVSSATAASGTGENKVVSPADEKLDDNEHNLEHDGGGQIGGQKTMKQSDSEMPKVGDGTEDSKSEQKPTDLKISGQKQIETEEQGVKENGSHDAQDSSQVSAVEQENKEQLGAKQKASVSRAVKGDKASVQPVQEGLGDTARPATSAVKATDMAVQAENVGNEHEVKSSEARVSDTYL